jgi:integrase
MAKLELRHVNAFRDRHGRLRHYFRRPGHRAIALPGDVGSAAFMDAYAGALASTAAPVSVGAERVKAGTIAALIATYYGSAEFASLATVTQQSRRTILDAFAREDGGKAVVGIERRHVERILAAIAKPHGRRNWIKAVRPLMRLAVAIGMRKDNPLDGIVCRLPKSGGYHTWTDEEIAQYRTHWPLGTKQRLAMELALETASRRADVTRLGPQHVRNGVIHIHQSKTRADVAIEVSGELQAAIAAAPTEHLTFLATRAGAPYAAKTLGSEFREWRDAAGLPKHCTMHGLRKGHCRQLAESGATVHEIKAHSGHRTLSEVSRYTEACDNARLAAEATRKLRARKTG